MQLEIILELKLRPGPLSSSLSLLQLQSQKSQPVFRGLLFASRSVEAVSFLKVFQKFIGKKSCYRERSSRMNIVPRNVFVRILKLKNAKFFLHFVDGVSEMAFR